MTAEEARKALETLAQANGKLIAATDAAAGGFLNAAVDAQERLYVMIAEAFAGAPDFSSITVSERFAWYTSIASEIDELVLGGGYRDAVTAYLDAYHKLAKLASGVLRAGGVDEAFATVPLRYIEHLIERDGAYFLDILGREAVRKIDDIVFEMSVGGYTRGSMLSELKGAITGEYPWRSRTGLYEWHGGTYARTSANRTAQMYLNIQASEAGIEKFIYLGPVDNKTREFCLGMVGGVYTRTELEGMDNGQTGDVLTDRGGWNCRHQLCPASDELAAAIAQYNLEAPAVEV